MLAIVTTPTSMNHYIALQIQFSLFIHAQFCSGIYFLLILLIGDMSGSYDVIIEIQNIWIIWDSCKTRNICVQYSDLLVVVKFRV